MGGNELSAVCDEQKMHDYIYDDVDDSDIFASDALNNSFTESDIKADADATVENPKIIQENEELKETVEKLLKDKETLQLRISELYKTARAELERKDRRLKDLEKEKDNIVFRRGNHFINKPLDVVSRVPVLQQVEKDLTNEEFQNFNPRYRIPKKISETCVTSTENDELSKKLNDIKLENKSRHNEEHNHDDKHWSAFPHLKDKPSRYDIGRNTVRHNKEHGVENRSKSEGPHGRQITSSSDNLGKDTDTNNDDEGRHIKDRSRPRDKYNSESYQPTPAQGRSKSSSRYKYSSLENHIRKPRSPSPETKQEELPKENSRSASNEDKKYIQSRSKAASEHKIRQPRTPSREKDHEKLSNNSNRSKEDDLKSIDKEKRCSSTSMEKNYTQSSKKRSKSTSEVVDLRQRKLSRSASIEKEHNMQSSRQINESKSRDNIEKDSRFKSSFRDMKDIYANNRKDRLNSGGKESDGDGRGDFKRNYNQPNTTSRRELDDNKVRSSRRNDLKVLSRRDKGSGESERSDSKTSRDKARCSRDQTKINDLREKCPRRSRSVSRERYSRRQGLRRSRSTSREGCLRKPPEKIKYGRNQWEDARKARNGRCLHRVRSRSSSMEKDEDRVRHKGDVQTRRDRSGNVINYKFRRNSKDKQSNLNVERSQNRDRKSKARDFGRLRERVLRYSIDRERQPLTRQDIKLNKNKATTNIETDQSDLDDLQLYLSGESDLENAKESRDEPDNSDDDCDFKVLLDSGVDPTNMTDAQLERLLEERRGLYQKVHGVSDGHHKDINRAGNTDLEDNFDAQFSEPEGNLTDNEEYDDQRRIERKNIEFCYPQDHVEELDYEVSKSTEELAHLKIGETKPRFSETVSSMVQQNKENPNAERAGKYGKDELWYTGDPVTNTAEHDKEQPQTLFNIRMRQRLKDDKPVRREETSKINRTNAQVARNSAKEEQAMFGSKKKPENPRYNTSNGEKRNLTQIMEKPKEEGLLLRNKDNEANKQTQVARNFAKEDQARFGSKKKSENHRYNTSDAERRNPTQIMEKPKEEGLLLRNKDNEANKQTQVARNFAKEDQARFGSKKKFENHRYDTSNAEKRNPTQIMERPKEEGLLLRNKDNEANKQTQDDGQEVTKGRVQGTYDNVFEDIHHLREKCNLARDEMTATRNKVNQGIDSKEKLIAKVCKSTVEDVKDDGNDKDQLKSVENEIVLVASKRREKITLNKYKSRRQSTDGKIKKHDVTEPVKSETKVEADIPAEAGKKFRCTELNSSEKLATENVDSPVDILTKNEGGNQKNSKNTNVTSELHDEGKSLVKNNKQLVENKKNNEENSFGKLKNYLMGNPQQVTIESHSKEEVPVNQSQQENDKDLNSFLHDFSLSDDDDPVQEHLKGGKEAALTVECNKKIHILSNITINSPSYTPPRPKNSGAIGVQKLENPLKDIKVKPRSSGSRRSLFKITEGIKETQDAVTNIPGIGDKLDYTSAVSNTAEKTLQMVEKVPQLTEAKKKSKSSPRESSECMEEIQEAVKNIMVHRSVHNSSSNPSNEAAEQFDTEGLQKCLEEGITKSKTPFLKTHTQECKNKGNIRKINDKHVDETKRKKREEKHKNNGAVILQLPIDKPVASNDDKLLELFGPMSPSPCKAMKEIFERHTNKDKAKRNVVKLDDDTNGFKIRDKNDTNKKHQILNNKDTQKTKESAIRTRSKSVDQESFRKIDQMQEILIFQPKEVEKCEPLLKVVEEKRVKMGLSQFCSNPTYIPNIRDTPKLIFESPNHYIEKKNQEMKEKVRRNFNETPSNEKVPEENRKQENIDSGKHRLIEEKSGEDKNPNAIKTVKNNIEKITLKKRTHQKQKEEKKTNTEVCSEGEEEEGNVQEVKAKRAKTKVKNKNSKENNINLPTKQEQINVTPSDSPDKKKTRNPYFKIKIKAPKKSNAKGKVQKKQKLSNSVETSDSLEETNQKGHIIKEVKQKVKMDDDDPSLSNSQLAKINNIVEVESKRLQQERKEKKPRQQGTKRKRAMKTEQHDEGKNEKNNQERLKEGQEGSCQEDIKKKKWCQIREEEIKEKRTCDRLKDRQEGSCQEKIEEKNKSQIKEEEIKEKRTCDRLKERQEGSCPENIEKKNTSQIREEEIKEKRTCDRLKEIQEGSCQENTKKNKRFQIKEDTGCNFEEGMDISQKMLPKNDIEARRQDTGPEEKSGLGNSSANTSNESTQAPGKTIKRITPKRIDDSSFVKEQKFKELKAQRELFIQSHSSIIGSNRRKRLSSSSEDCRVEKYPKVTHTESTTRVEEDIIDPWTIVEVKMDVTPHSSPLSRIEQTYDTLSRHNAGQATSSDSRFIDAANPQLQPSHEGVFPDIGLAFEDKNSINTRQAANDTLPIINLDTKDLSMLGPLEKNIYFNMTDFSMSCKSILLEGESNVDDNKVPSTRNVKEKELSFTNFLNRNQNTSTPIKNRRALSKTNAGSKGGGNVVRNDDIGPVVTSSNKPELQKNVPSSVCSGPVPNTNVSDFKSSSRTQCSVSDSSSVSRTYVGFSRTLKRDRRRPIRMTVVD